MFYRRDISWAWDAHCVYQCGANGQVQPLELLSLGYCDRWNSFGEDLDCVFLASTGYEEGIQMVLDWHAEYALPKKSDYGAPTSRVE